MKNRLIFNIALGGIFSVVSFNAFSDIGGIGSPVVPSNGPVTVRAPNSLFTGSNASSVRPGNSANSAPSPDINVSPKEAGTTILTVDFALHHPAFEDMLKQALAATQNGDTKVRYMVVSTIPATYSKKQLSEDLRVSYQANLADVVNAMISDGVSGNNIQTSIAPSDDVTNQQVSIIAQ